MVYPQCLLNFIELLYSWGAAHGNIVQTVLDIFEGLTCSMFQNHPLTSLHKRVLPWKDTLTQDSIGGFSFLHSLPWEFESTSGASPQSGLNRRILSFFILWHAHELDDMLGVFPKRSVFFFLFSIRFFQVRSLCVCVCVFFASPFEWRHEAVPWQITKCT